MGKLTPAILVFIISGLVYIFSSLFEYNTVVLVSKPVFISSAIFHYWIQANGKISFLNLLVLLLYFLSGSLNLFRDDNMFKYVLFLNMSVYLILLFSLFKKMTNLKIEKLKKIKVVFIALLVLFTVILAYFALFFVFTKKFELFNYLIVYVFVLSSLVIAATTLFLFRKTLGNGYLMWASYSYLLCDLFYALYNYSFGFTIFRFLSVFGSVISYYFIINHFLLTSPERDI